MKKPIRTAIPVVRQLFEIITNERLTDAALGRRMGWNRDDNYLRKWKAGRSDPALRNLEAVADALGYEIMLVRKRGL